MAAGFCEDGPEIGRGLNLQKKSYSVRIQKEIKRKRITSTMDNPFSITIYPHIDFGYGAF